MKEDKTRLGGIQRRQVSVRGVVYNRLKEVARERGVTIAQLVEEIVEPALPVADSSASR